MKNSKCIPTYTISSIRSIYVTVLYIYSRVRVFKYLSAKCSSVCAESFVSGGSSNTSISVLNWPETENPCVYVQQVLRSSATAATTASPTTLGRWLPRIADLSARRVVFSHSDQPSLLFVVLCNAHTHTYIYCHPSQRPLVTLRASPNINITVLQTYTHHLSVLLGSVFFVK